MKILSISILLALSSQLAAEDTKPPYEYIDWVALGENYSSTDDNDLGYGASGAIAGWLRKEKFPPGEGKCMETLNETIKKSLEKDNVNLSMYSHNNYLEESNRPNDIRVRHVKFRCVKFLGSTDECMADVDQTVDKFIKENKPSAVTMAALMLEASKIKKNVCTARNVVGETEYFHLPGYENDEMPQE